MCLSYIQFKVNAVFFRLIFKKIKPGNHFFFRKIRNLIVRPAAFIIFYEKQNNGNISSELFACAEIIIDSQCVYLRNRSFHG